MAQDKFPVKDVLASIDLNGKIVWKELSPEQQKSVSFWLLNRYVSCIRGNRDKQEMAIMKVNEYYNKHFYTIGVGKEKGHPLLMWQLLCASGNWGDTLVAMITRLCNRRWNVDIVGCLKARGPYRTSCSSTVAKDRYRRRSRYWSNSS